LKSGVTKLVIPIGFEVIEATPTFGHPAIGGEFDVTKQKKAPNWGFKIEKEMFYCF
jgi:hypothetical protein